MGERAKKNVLRLSMSERAGKKKWNPLAFA